MARNYPRKQKREKLIIIIKEKKKTHENESRTKLPIAMRWEIDNSLAN